MERVRLSLAALPILFMSLASCSNPDPIVMASASVVIGERPLAPIRGLNPDAEYALVVEATDAFRRQWRSESTFSSDGCGRIDLSRDVPSNELYTSPDPFGVLASMSMLPKPENWQKPKPRDFNDITFTLYRESKVIAKAETRQWIFPPDIESKRIGGPLVAELFYSGDRGRLPGVVLFGGSGGGMDWARRSAASLARHGFATLAVAYFNAEGLPPDLVEIPVEYAELAIDSLKARREVDSTKISIVGYSKGAELALLVASRRIDVGAVVAFAPGSAVFQGFRQPDYPVISSWSVDGVGLPFVPNAYDKKFFETYDGMYLWYRTLAQNEAFTAAAIPVERINGDILLISGVDDKIWPATFMAEQIVARLRVNDFGHTVRHMAYADAGHGIAAPPGEPLTSVAERLGGTVLGNSRARSEGWRATVDFLLAVSAETLD